MKAFDDVKDYPRDLLKFGDRLRERKPFALARYGDGELYILRGSNIDYEEWKYDPSDAASSK